MGLSLLFLEKDRNVMIRTCYVRDCHASSHMQSLLIGLPHAFCTTLEKD